VSELRLADVVTALVSTRDRMLEKAAHADVAIEALRKLLDGPAVEEPKALAAPPARRAAKVRVAGKIDHKGHQVLGAKRPRTTVCKNDRCGKEFSIRVVGRVPHYCSDLCRKAQGKRERSAIKERRKAIEDHNAAAPAEVDDLLRVPEPIPESGPGMRARLSKLLAQPGTPRSTFLETVRGRNDEAARRSAAGR
jgi:hypothetical protein